MDERVSKPNVSAITAATERHWGLWGEEGQKKIRNTTVALVGLGGVGGISALMLAKGGLGKLILCDRDQYAIENLAQQVFANYDTIGMNKADAARHECARHTQITEIEGVVGDISDRDLAQRLVEQTDIVVSAVDNYEARNMVGFTCAKLNTPLVLPSTVGWGVIHTVYMPGEFAYDSLWRRMGGIITKDGLPDLSNDRTRALLQREWDIWVLILSNFQPEAMRRFLTSERKRYWNAAPQCFFAACQGVLDLWKIITGVGDPVIFPQVFSCNMKTNRVYDMSEINEKRIALYQVWDQGPEAILEVVQSWES